jgi:hypothetical protein
VHTLNDRPRLLALFPVDHLVLRGRDCHARTCPAPIERIDRFVKQVPFLVRQGGDAGHDDVDGAFGNVGDAGRGREGEIEDGGVDGEGLDAAIASVNYHLVMAWSSRHDYQKKRMRSQSDAQYSWSWLGRNVHLDLHRTLDRGAWHIRSERREECIGRLGRRVRVNEAVGINHE